MIHILVQIYSEYVIGIFDNYGDAESYLVKLVLNITIDQWNNGCYDVNFENYYNENLNQYNIMSGFFNIDPKKNIYVKASDNNFIISETIENPAKYASNTKWLNGG